MFLPVVFAMRHIRFVGRVLPTVYQVTITPPPPRFGITYDHNGLELAYNVKIEKSIFTIDCDVNKSEYDHFTFIYYTTFSFVQSIIDVVSFSSSHALAVTIDEFFDGDGVSSQMGANQPPEVVRKTCIPVGGPTFGAAYQMVMSDLRFSGALRDLIEAVRNLSLAPINCARAVEGIRHAMSPTEMERDKQWASFNENLRADPAYSRRIMNHALDPRHGNPKSISFAEINELIIRSWTLMDRYFEFRIRGGQQPLPLAQFPLLTG